MKESAEDKEWTRYNKTAMIGTMCRVPGLSTGSTYKFQISAKNAAGEAKLEIAERVTLQDQLEKPKMCLIPLLRRVWLSWLPLREPLSSVFLLFPSHLWPYQFLCLAFQFSCLPPFWLRLLFWRPLCLLP
jgi:hypothetical protein